MSLSESVYSMLIVSASDTFNETLTSLLPSFKLSCVITESNVGSAKRVLAERSFDLIVVNSPLPDDAGIRFAIDMSGLGNSVVLLFVRSELYAEVYDRVFSHGVYVLPKPTSKTIFTQALDWMISTRERLKLFEKKTVSTEEKMREIRIVNKAKWILIDRLKMTESDAHRHIEKQAMDMCLSKREIAEDIIRTYG